MKKLPFLFCFTILACMVSTGCSSKNSPESSEKVTNVKAVSFDDIVRLNDGKMLDVTYYYDTKRVKELNGRLSSTPVKNKDDAMTVIRELSDIIGCKEPLNELEYSEMKLNDNIFAYVFDQYYNDIPVKDGKVSVSADASGVTTRLINSYVDVDDIDTKPKISEESAVKIAREKYSCNTKGEPELMIMEVSRGVSLVWNIKLDRSKYPDETFIDAENGIIRAEDGPLN